MAPHVGAIIEIDRSCSRRLNLQSTSTQSTSTSLRRSRRQHDQVLSGARRSLQVALPVSWSSGPARRSSDSVAVIDADGSVRGVIRKRPYTGTT